MNQPGGPRKGQFALWKGQWYRVLWAGPKTLTLRALAEGGANVVEFAPCSEVAEVRNFRPAPPRPRAIKSPLGAPPRGNRPAE